MIGPVFLIDSHLIFLDDQDVKVGGSIHGMIQVEQPVLMTARGGGKNGAFDAVWIL